MSRWRTTEQLLLWVFIGVGGGAAPLIVRVISGQASIRSQLESGEVLLVSAGILAGAIGHAAMVVTERAWGILKAFIIGPGVLCLVVSATLYGTSQAGTASGDRIPRKASFVIAASAMVIGVASVVVVARGK